MAEPKKIFGVRVWLEWDAGEGPVSIEESIVVVKACAEEEALAKVRGKLDDRNDEYISADKSRVSIRPVRVDTAFPTLEERFIDGMEVFSQLYELEEGGTFGWTLDEVRSEDGSLS